MFSKFFRRKGSDPFARPVVTVKSLSIFELIKESFTEDKREKELLAVELAKFKIIARELCHHIERIETHLAQGLLTKAYESARNLHVTALEGLRLDSMTSWDIAIDNDLPANSFLFSSRYGMLEEGNKDNEDLIFRYAKDVELPEFIFITKMRQWSFLEVNNERRRKHKRHVMLFLRVVMELRVATSRIIHHFENDDVLDAQLIKKLVVNRSELCFLVSPNLTIRVLIDAEEEREDALKVMALDQTEQLVVPLLPADDLSANSDERKVTKIVEIHDTPAELFIQFIATLEEQHHRRDIFFTIATEKYYLSTKKPSFKGLWEWMEEHLSNKPFRTEMLGHPIQISICGDLLEHRGVLNNPDWAKEISKDSVFRNSFSKMNRIYKELQAFCEENNISNISSII